MRNTLALGATGADVVLLQTRLNALPTALPLLDIDGVFGPATLARIKEFQATAFVNGIVGTHMWGSLLATIGNGKETFFTVGRDLFDPAGNKVILRGVNKMSVWDSGDPTGEVYFPEIHKSAANAVRIVWTMRDDNGAPTDLTRLDALITNAWRSWLIPMVELHDATGNWAMLPELASYWTQADVVALVQKHQAYLLVNIGNEVGDDQVTRGDFIAGYTAAVTAMRSAGIRTPLVIDASSWGQDSEMLDATAAALIAADPERNLVFSVHVYWSKDCGFDAQRIRTSLEASVALGYPLIVGEFSKFGGYPCNHQGASICGPYGEIDYQTVLQVCDEHRIGWFAWEWGPGNALGSPPDPLCAALDMTPDGLFAHLKPGWAQDVVFGPFGLANPPQPEAPPMSAITSTPGGERNDPEGVAAPEDVTLLKWKDSRNADRTLALGSFLHQYNFSFDDNLQIVSRSANDDADGHPGFGYVVSHNDQNDNSPLGKVNHPSAVETVVHAGGHHGFHRVTLVYERDKEAGGRGVRIPVVIRWFVATGRDHPVWAVTWDMATAQNPQNVDFGAYRMDVRGPYGSLNFDGASDAASGDVIGGVAWGDCGFRFRTTDEPLNLNSAWSYDAPGSVNFVQAWTANSNAEMGIVQTIEGDKSFGYPDRVAGRERGHTSAENYLEKSHCNDWGDNRHYALPCMTGWPYQLMNYDWDPAGGKPPGEPTATKLLAWGSPYGWLGAPGFDLFDYSAQADGTGERAYATFIVLGPKHRFNPVSGNWDGAGDVSLAIAEVEALTAATVNNVGPGTLATVVPKGPGAAQMKSIVNGYDDSYAAYWLAADGNTVAFTFIPAAGKPVHNPIFAIEDYTTSALPNILVNGVAVPVNADAEPAAFVSIDATDNVLWITLRATVLGATNIGVMQAGS